MTVEGVRLHCTLHRHSRWSRAGSGSPGCRQEGMQCQQFWRPRVGYGPGMAQSWKPCTHRFTLEDCSPVAAHNWVSGFSQGRQECTCIRTPQSIRLNITCTLCNFYPVCSSLQLSGRYVRIGTTASLIQSTLTSGFKNQIR